MKKPFHYIVVLASFLSVKTSFAEVRSCGSALSEQSVFNHYSDSLTAAELKGTRWIDLFITGSKAEIKKFLDDNYSLTKSKIGKSDNEYDFIYIGGDHSWTVNIRANKDRADGLVAMGHTSLAPLRPLVNHASEAIPFMTGPNLFQLKQMKNSDRVSVQVKYLADKAGFDGKQDIYGSNGTKYFHQLNVIRTSGLKADSNIKIAVIKDISKQDLLKLQEVYPAVLDAKMVIVDSFDALNLISK